MTASTATAMAYATSPQGINYHKILETKRRVSSSSSFFIDGLSGSFRAREETTRPAQSKQYLAIVVIEGIQLVFSQGIMGNLQTEAYQGNDNIQLDAAIHTERLDLIKDRLALTVTQTAELFGVTRKTVYDWYEGAEPRRPMMNRVEILIDLLDAMTPDVDLRRLKAIWNITVSGKSFLSVFHDDSMDAATLRTALAEKLNELSARMAPKVGSTRKTTTYHGESHLAEFDRRTDFN